jgi:hypothetical protein
MGRRWLAAPALVVGSVVAISSGCTQSTVCDANLQAKAQALEGAVSDLVTVSTQMRSQLAVACAQMAKDLGQTPPSVGDGSGVTDDTLTQVCNLAAMAIKTKIAATSKIVPVIQAPKCTFDAQTQIMCEGTCDASGMCQPGTIEARCNPGDLSVQCQGTCNAMATCEGSAMVAATCQGTCDATCTGTCAGNCVGTCDTMPSMTTCAGMCQGRCDASCKGTCTGNCKLDANAMIMCGANVTCRGGCTGKYTAPTCEGVLKPPSCNVDAECEAGCKSRATLRATCTPPTVSILAGGDATLKMTLETNMPVVAAVGAQAVLVAMAAKDVSTAANNVVGELQASAACAVVIGADFATKIQATVAAAATVDVSVTATVTVTGSLAG